MALAVRPEEWLRLPVKEAGGQDHQQINPSQPPGWLREPFARESRCRVQRYRAADRRIHKNLKAGLDLEKLKIQVGEGSDQPR